MKRILVGITGLLVVIAISPFAGAQAPLHNVLLGHSGGAGSLNNLRRILEREKIWEKHGLNVKSVYFNSGTVLTQAMAGGNIAGSESEVPGMLNLAVSGVADLKLVTVTINKIEHVFVVRKNIAKPEDLKGKRLAVSRIGSASDTVTRMVLRSWKIDADKEVTLLQSGNTPTRMTALLAGHVDGALVSPESVHKVIAAGCCRVLADLAELPIDYARYGYVFPTAFIKSQREILRRLLMAYLEGIAIFRTRPRAAYAALEEEGIKDPAVQKDIYERALKHVREYPVPEPNGIQSVLDSLSHPNAKTAKPHSIMDTSILEEIRKSGFIDKLYARAPKNE
jgi:NitT/TauT family transport system substrate-binding protein